MSNELKEKKHNKTIANIFNFLCSLFKINDKKIVFQAISNKIDGNPYAIYKYIKENCPNDFITIWLIPKDADISMLEKGDYAYNKTFAFFYHLTTAKYWIRSHCNGSVIKKKKNQVYLQTWHGAGNFKKCGYDITNETNRIPAEFVQEWDYFLAPDSYNVEAIHSSCGYNNKSLVVGMARTDMLLKVNKDIILETKKRFKLPLNKQLILYAPTFRDNDLETDDYSFPLKNISRVKNSIFLIRLHPLISQKIKKVKLPNNCIDVGHISDILDLLIISDVLITDYSSSIYDYSILNRPILFYAYDYDEYVKVRGGFYLDYKKDLPGPIVYSEQDLISKINDMEKIKKEYKNKLKDFNIKYNYMNDGHVSERIVKLIKEKKLG